MHIDSPAGQNKIAAWSMVSGGAIFAILYLLSYHWLALGVAFGTGLILANWRVLSFVLRIAFRFSSPHMARLISFVSYHVRFWIVVIIMFLVIPKTNLYFGVGTFLGILVPKITMGIILYRKRSDEWWIRKFPDDEKPLRPLSYIEKELVGKNPFEVDLIEVEVKRYYKYTKGDSKCMD